MIYYHIVRSDSVVVAGVARVIAVAGVAATATATVTATTTFAIRTVTPISSEIH